MNPGNSPGRIQFAEQDGTFVLKFIGEVRLTLCSALDSTIEKISKGIKAGNCYVNRNMIGAVVGVQPFGGEGLSGTGPKAGGPHYLLRFVNERTLTINTTAAGGNASLLTLGD